MLQSRLTARYMKLVQNIYTEPVDEKVMGEFIFNFTMTLPPLLPSYNANSSSKQKKRRTHQAATVASGANMKKCKKN